MKFSFTTDDSSLTISLIDWKKNPQKYCGSVFKVVLEFTLCDTLPFFWKTVNLLHLVCTNLAYFEFSAI